MTNISLSFIQDLPLYNTVKPYAIHSPLANVPESQQSNIVEAKQHDIPLIDARSLPDNELAYQAQGFRFLRHEVSSTWEFNTAPEHLKRYCRQMIEFAKDEFGAEVVMCYDIRVRHGDETAGEYMDSTQLGRSHAAPPVFSVHIDHTKTSAYSRMQRHLTTAEASKYLSPQFRARIINIWRPIHHPITTFPLAYSDARTITPSTDLIAVDQVSADYVFDLYQVKYSPAQKWYWLSGQTPDEIAVFVQFDSEDSAAGNEGIRASPHASFRVPVMEGQGPPRESVEVRLMVFNRVEEK